MAVINVNINDWKFVYDNFGVEKSDSLIQVVASIVKKEAGAEYIIGRIDGDVFLVLIPLAEDGEAEDYCRRVQAACQAYDEDEVLAPSVATGIVYRTNVEESLEEKMSDAEYDNRRNQRAGRPFVEPIYTVEDAMRTMAYVHTCEYDQEVGICEGVTATFTDATL